MEVKAAVAHGPGQALAIETVQLEGPQAGEVMVEIKATGVCHTDAYTLSGRDPEGLFPAILGHEGAGVVVEVGAGVTGVQPGDRVIPLYTPECRQCRFCLSRKTNLCQAIRHTQGQGVMPDGRSRFSLRGQPLYHYMGTSTFANYTVLPEIAVAKIRADAPFDKVCYIGCGVTTGIGAVIFTAKVEPGANVVVFGLGGIGLNVIQGCRMVGASKIVGVDLNPARRAIAEEFGMTHFVNPKEVAGDLVSYLIELTDGGADFSFECIGNVQVMRQALECCHKGWGKCTIIGVAAAGEEIATRPFQLVTGRVWMGSAFGGARGRTDVPKIVDWYMENRIHIDPLITHTLPLDRINEAFDLMHRGESIRTNPMAAVSSTPECRSWSRCFGGTVAVYRHASRECRCDMQFSIYLPPQAEAHPVPVLYYLSGLTCTEENFMSKAGAQRYAAEHGLALVAPDTSPRGEGVPDDPNAWDFGMGAGFYVDATIAPWDRHYRTYSYVVAELPDLIAAHFPIRADRAGICGHSMGGHGALVCGLRHRDRYRSISALAPIAAPMQCPWGEKAFSGYLGGDRLTWRAYDATELVVTQADPSRPILIDVGTADVFLTQGQLLPEVFAAACQAAGQPLTLRQQEGYDHGYYFVATFIGDHIRHHAAVLHG